MSDKIYIGINDKRIEAKGKELEQILARRAKVEEKLNELYFQQQAKQATLDSAIAKLAKLGLTEDEAKAIIGIQ